MSKFKITGTVGSGLCEDCGYYGWENISVSVDGISILSHSGDDHLGGGMWYEWQRAVTEILQAMGHDVTIDLEHEDE